MKKKLNKLKVSIIIVVMVLAFTITVFGRYIYNSIRETYLTTKQFYFTSNILTATGANYRFTNWDGEEVYAIEFDLNTYINETTKLNYDLTYKVTATASEADSAKIKCTINSYSASATNEFTGSVSSPPNTSKVVVYVTPLVTIPEGDSVTINVEATTSVPYQKTLSCKFTLTRETPSGISYDIEDVAGRDYALLRVTNTNVVPTQITIEFDPTKLRINSNDEFYVEKEENGMETDTIEGSDEIEYTYVKEFVTEIDAECTRYVKFYKVDKQQNYTWTGVAGENEITISSRKNFSS